MGQFLEENAMDAWKSRRAFLRAAATVSIAAPFVLRYPRARALDAAFDPDFGTASAAMRAIRGGVISCRELTQHTFARIEKFNSPINAFVTLAKEQALVRAIEADTALANGVWWGPLHGLPILVKDLRATAGIRTTYGSKKYESNIPKDDDLVVARLKAAGAIIVGKTNTPDFGADFQTYNEVAGVTNNPWDLKRTSGGSTGGGAAALAAGLGFLEIGSDQGGSIRNPAHFCGIYGHKPSFDLVPRVGPRPPDARIATRDNLWVNGPMARSAQDLMLELAIIAGPVPQDAIAYKLSMPSPRGTRLTDYRIGFVLSDPFCPPTSEVTTALSSLVDGLAKHGAQVTEGWPDGVKFQQNFEDYWFLLINGLSFREEDIKKRLEGLKGKDDYYAILATQALSASHQQWRDRDVKRLEARSIWQNYFKDHDAFIMPVSLSPAFPHALQKDWNERSIETSEGKRNYRDIARWFTMPTFTGCPATVAPIGRTKEELPIGVQIMGPFLEDATTISIAGLLADVVGGFQPPPGYTS